jgi:hypothetical protein
MRHLERRPSFAFASEADSYGQRPFSVRGYLRVPGRTEVKYRQHRMVLQMRRGVDGFACFSVDK